MKKLVAMVLAVLMISGVALAEERQFDKFSAYIPDGLVEVKSIERDGHWLYGDAGGMYLLVDKVDGTYDVNGIERVGEPFTIGNYTELNRDSGKIGVFTNGADTYVVALLTMTEIDTVKAWDRLINSARIDGEPVIPREEVEYALLEFGAKGDAVKAMQERLIELHYLPNGGADGDYGSKTKNAIEHFQKQAGLPVTGSADNQTQQAIFSVDAKEAMLEVSYSLVMLGSYGQCAWNVDGNKFTLSGDQTKVLDTWAGQYKFRADGTYERVG